MKFKAKVYVASPMYSSGTIEQNIDNAVNEANKLLDLGFAPYLPQHNHYWNLKQNREVDVWMDFDYSWLEVCDCLLKIPGYSIGADKEVEWMKQHNKPVFYSIEDIDQFYSNKEQ